MNIYINVANTYRLKGKSGIQRVVRELVSRLSERDNIYFLVWYRDDFYLITEKADFGFFCEGREFYPDVKMALENFNPGDCFFDLDASWLDQYCIYSLYGALKEAGVILIKMHYDAVPVLFPQYSHVNTVFNYTDNFSTALQFADYWVCISNTVKKDLETIASKLAVRQPRAVVIDLGADFESANLAENTTFFQGYIEDPFFLCVGTLEPRKNHSLLLDVYEQMLEKGTGFNLVLVGKKGWNVESIEERIINHPHYNARIFWLTDATDEQVAHLYKKAYLSINLSYYEGYGLPIIESLYHNCISVCTKGGAMEEVSCGAAICVELSAPLIVEALNSLSDKSEYLKWKCKAEEFKPPTWEKTCLQVEHFFTQIQTPLNILFPPKQAVYISIRPAALLRSFKSVVNYMNFISEAVVLTPASCVPEMEKIAEKIPLQLSIISEESLGITELPDDHQERNTYLRKMFYFHEKIDPNFIAFDDDYLVRCPVEREVFVEHGKHRGYYFFEDGKEWLGAYPIPTSFDRGLWRTAKFLSSSGFDVRLYNSHMPQIINKDIALSVYDTSVALGLDEWSSYFNIGKHLYPQFFVDTKYIAMGWPPNFDSWLGCGPPSSVPFENYYDDESSLDEDASEVEYSEYANKWLEDYKNACDLRGRVEPIHPEIHINDGQVTFNAEAVRCDRSIRLFIKYVAHCTDFEIECRYGGYSDRFRDSARANLFPRFFRIPTDIFKKEVAGEFEVIVTFVKTGQKDSVKVPIFFK
ncbi:glycosyltransferase family 4 protein [Desulfogranum marinum]|uniref:glycosyltransferase family 4 protein n=1 Tax=Desulfogranum marinum TaxID=453220 RepID=UPI0019667461|nr:glycosyltransferase family 1 protein [Desulfogranum marinum]MBM9513023.1 glycosyltransferase family 4 protein [Desulfogranum marinum]